MAIASTKTSNTAANKIKYKAKCERHLAKHKAKRLEKYGHLPVTELTRNTLVLFARWGHRTAECKSAIRAKRFKAPVKKKTGFAGYWG